VKNKTCRLWTSALTLLCSGTASAATGAAFLTVTINLNGPALVPAASSPQATVAPATNRQICVSQTLSEQNNALVQVTCATGQFVSITPIPGRPFLGTHGGAFRYRFDSGKSSGGGQSGQDNPFVGTGTVTALRIYNADGSGGPLEMLVSF
jgi:hypothetical protein